MLAAAATVLLQRLALPPPTTCASAASISSTAMLLSAAAGLYLQQAGICSSASTWCGTLLTLALSSFQTTSIASATLPHCCTAGTVRNLLPCAAEGQDLHW